MKKNQTYILEFEVVKPTNDMETIGEILYLSQFGEYCPNGSLRGYALAYLLYNSQNYRVSKIMQKGIIIVIPK